MPKQGSIWLALFSPFSPPLQADKPFPGTGLFPTAKCTTWRLGKPPEAPGSQGRDRLCWVAPRNSPWKQTKVPVQLPGPSHPLLSMEAFALDSGHTGASLLPPPSCQMRPRTVLELVQQVRRKAALVERHVLVISQRPQCSEL